MLYEEDEKFRVIIFQVFQEFLKIISFVCKLLIIYLSFFGRNLLDRGCLLKEVQIIFEQRVRGLVQGSLVLNKLVFNELFEWEVVYGRLFYVLYYLVFCMFFFVEF